MQRSLSVANLLGLMADFATAELKAVRKKAKAREDLPQVEKTFERSRSEWWRTVYQESPEKTPIPPAHDRPGLQNSSSQLPPP